MTQVSTATANPEVLMFHAANVTGTQQLPIEVVAGSSVRSVADSIAHRMALPGDVPWSLRDDGSSTYLDEDRPIGDQIEPGSHLTITPKTHLGGRGSPLV